MLYQFWGARLSLSQPIKSYVFLTSLKLLKLRPTSNNQLLFHKDPFATDVFKTSQDPAYSNNQLRLPQQCLGGKQGKL
jgi:hypothetical protein